MNQIGVTIKSEFKRYPLLYFVLFILTVVFVFIRTFRLSDLLGFYYDQGRDALVIWRFLHEGDLFLIGPTTGIEGIYRGPWYYFLILPFYLFGKGDPVWPATFLGLLSTAALLLLYFLGFKTGGRFVGFLAFLIGGFSYYLVLASRWLSNPTPMLAISMLLVLGMFLVMEGKRWGWVLIALMLGMAMQFGSAVEVFYFPAILIFAIWQRRHLPSLKIFLVSLFVLFLAFVPQIIFDIRHQGVLSSAIARFLFEQESFKVSFWEVFQQRLNLYYSVFFIKLFPSSSIFWKLFLFVLIVSAVVNFQEIIKNQRFMAVLLLFFSALIGMLFFQGNNNTVYDYYFTGYYLIFVLIFATLLTYLVKKTRGEILIAVFLILFLQENIVLIRNYLTSQPTGPTHITLGNELEAVNWVFKDAGGQEFNVDVYVPPVIPYAYNYLFLWQGTKRCGVNLCGLVQDRKINLLYTLYEVDPPHPERLEAWLKRQEGIGLVEKQVSFGGITVQRRRRL